MGQEIGPFRQRFEVRWKVSVEEGAGVTWR